MGANAGFLCLPESARRSCREMASTHPAQRHWPVKGEFDRILRETLHPPMRPMDVRFAHVLSGRIDMNAPRRRYVLNLPDWDLPRLDGLEWKLVERLAENSRVRRLRSESLEDAFHDILHANLLELVESTVNEILEYWLKGLGDGNNGRWPELCVELPYLEPGENTDPLTMTYCVDHGDGTRTELNRTTLDAVMSRFFDGNQPAAHLRSRARMTAFALRQLAEKLERR